MPLLDSVTVWLWFVGTAANLAICALTFATGHFRRWPSLFTYLALINCKSIYCAIANACGNSYHYFWGFWTFQCLIDLAEFWIVIQIALRVVPPLFPGRRWIAPGIMAYTAGSFCVFAVLSFLDQSAPNFRRVVYVADHLNIAACLALCVICTTLVWITRGIGIQWSGGVRGVSCGLLVEVLSCDVASFLDLRPTAAANSVQSASYLVTLGIWCVSIIRWYRSPRTETRAEFAHTGSLG